MTKNQREQNSEMLLAVADASGSILNSCYACDRGPTPPHVIFMLFSMISLNVHSARTTLHADVPDEMRLPVGTPKSSVSALWKSPHADQPICLLSYWSLAGRGSIPAGATRKQASSCKLTIPEAIKICCAFTVSFEGTHQTCSQFVMYPPVPLAKKFRGIKAEDPISKQPSRPQRHGMRPAIEIEASAKASSLKIEAFAHGQDEMFLLDPWL